MKRLRFPKLLWDLLPGMRTERTPAARSTPPTRKGGTSARQAKYDALVEEMKGPIHALTLETYAPGERT